ncbi:unnamed protein product [Parascedosporium putredinis]|uniref:Maf-like protein n=1 Tax=Parascedosporium putredinis TaxID=1442378 RepID=A0A9P1H9X2_9PEZI|nr:unnamed protein product [Parascedosporium putredinis]CAI8002109.1 unnamed protein product [Parascedosporium putredinis]
MADSKDATAPTGGPPNPNPPLRTRFKPLDIPILKHLRSQRVILASASPRRKALLAQNVDKKTHSPAEYVAATAVQKCLDVYEAAVNAQSTATATADTRPSDPALVISADTVVVSRDGRILEKPRDRADHIRMLRHLRDTRVHSVLTSVCVLAPREDAQHPGYVLETHTEETKAYVSTGEGIDKAGGYAVQGIGGMLLVERVDGSVDNVVGLPVRQTLALAERVVFRQDDDGGDDDE